MKRHKQKILRNETSIAENNQEKDLSRNSLRMKRHKHKHSGIRLVLKKTSRKDLRRNSLRIKRHKQNTQE